MKRTIPAVALLLALVACGSEAEQAAESPDAVALAAPAIAAGDGASAGQITIDFGDDNGRWSNDNECDDSRFEGAGMTATPLLEEDIGHDATDCRTAYEAGNLTLRGISTGK